MSAYDLLNLSNLLQKSDKMLSKPRILSLFHNEFDRFNKSGAQMFDSIYHMTQKIFEVVSQYFGHIYMKLLRVS